MDYRDKFRNLRIDNDFEQKDVAKICNVTNKTVSHWETHRREMPVDCIIRLCQFYDISSDDIFELTKDRSK